MVRGRSARICARPTCCCVSATAAAAERVVAGCDPLRCELEFDRPGAAGADRLGAAWTLFGTGIPPTVEIRARDILAGGRRSSDAAGYAKLAAYVEHYRLQLWSDFTHFYWPAGDRLRMRAGGGPEYSSAARPSLTDPWFAATRFLYRDALAVAPRQHKRQPAEHAGTHPPCSGE